MLQRQLESRTEQRETVLVLTPLSMDAGPGLEVNRWGEVGGCYHFALDNIVVHRMQQRCAAPSQVTKRGILQHAVSGPKSRSRDRSIYGELKLGFHQGLIRKRSRSHQC